MFQSQRSSRLSLHRNTFVSVDDFCMNFLTIIRRSQISKTAANDLLLFISNLLPAPHLAPTNMKSLLNRLNVFDYFERRKICLLCRENISDSLAVCGSCSRAEPKHVAFILDANIESLMKRIVERLIDQIREYKRIINSGTRDIPYDIPFSQQYKRLLNQNKKRNLLSLILHFDGISLVKSTKLKLWLCSSSIVELPPNIRTQRTNIMLFSMYIGHTEPDVKLWLEPILIRFQDLKKTGMICDF